MNLLTKHKLSLFLAMAVCMCVPVNVYATNSGGHEDIPNPGDYTGAVASGNTNADNADVKIDTAVTGGFYGGYAADGNASNNKVQIDNAIIGGSSFGGYTDNGNAIGNIVIMNGAQITDSANRNLTGGYVAGGKGSSLYNRIELKNNSLVKGHLYGAFVEGSGDAAYNTLVISDASTVTQKTYGGYSDLGNSYNNLVEINNGILKGDVLGGMSWEQSATGNKVVMQDGTVTGSIYGGYASKDAGKDAVNNTIELHGGKVDGFLSGGQAGGDVTNNKIIITGCEVTNNIFGGLSSGSGVSQYNSVIVTGGILNNASIFGGLSSNSDAAYNSIDIQNVNVSGIRGGEAQTTGNANYNIVSVKNAEARYIQGGYSEYGESSYNIVTINNVDISGNAHGGIAQSGAGKAVGNILVADKLNGNFIVGAYSSGQAMDNMVIITNSTATKSVIGAEGNEVSNNTVHMTNSTANYVYGGYAQKSSDGNTVNISGGKVGSYLIGGYTATGDAINNIVNISGNIDLSTANVYGGDSGNGDARTGNTLNLSTQITTVSVANFENYNFSLVGKLDKSQAMIQTTNNIDLKGSTLDIDYIDNKSNINKGDTIILMDKSDNAGQATLKSGDVQVGIARLYEYNIYQDVNNKILANIKDVKINHKTQSLSEGRMASMSMVNGGTDLVASSALNNAAQASDKFDVFSAVNYGQMRLNSGSHVDVQGSNMLVGMSRNIYYNNSQTTVGAFMEAGWGTYDTYNSFTDGDVKANGHTNYYGLGILGKSKYNSGVYTEGSVRVGRIGNTYNSRDLNNAAYDITSIYYGLHIGIGKLNKLNDKTSLDVYSKYFWTHQTGADAAIAGDKFEFNSMDSHRLRVGARINNVNKNINRYLGLAYEYEFSNNARASSYGLDIAAPNVKGSTGVLELGVNFKPDTDSKFSMDFGVNGYIGKRQGISGNMKLNWGF